MKTKTSTGSSPVTFGIDSLNQLYSDGNNGYSYDAFGNRSSKVGSGLKLDYSYDDANQLIAVQTDPATTTTGTLWRTEFVYDGFGRMCIRREFDRVGGAWVLSSTRRYLYSGFQLVQERDGNNVPLVSYSRGLDLSGTATGAGGIGGLLGRHQHDPNYPAGAYQRHDGQYHGPDGRVRDTGGILSLRSLRKPPESSGAGHPRRQQPTPFQFQAVPRTQWHVLLRLPLLRSRRPTMAK